MNKYYGTYLKDYKFTIPEELFWNGSILKHEKLYFYGIVRKEPVESDDIQLFITPYTHADLKKNLLD